MRLLVVVSQVPDSRSAIKVAPDHLGIEPAGVKYVCNPFDEFAVEQAVVLKETRSDVEEIVVATIGGPDSTQALRAALAMGGDRGLHVSDERFESHDEIFLARALAAAIRSRSESFDLVLTGKQAIDTDAGEFGPALAEFLDLPHVGAVVRLELADDATSLQANRRIEGADEIVRTPLPALITCEKGLIEPRFPSLPNLMKAKKKPVDTVTPSDLAALESMHPASTLVQLTPPAPRPPCTFIEGEPEEMARELVRRLRDEAGVI